MNDPKLLLSWDAYQKNICNGLGKLQQSGEFVDMTIAADGHHVKVHQMIMSLVSPYIKELITSAQCPHPVIFLNRVSYPTLQSILEYAYTGEVMVARDRLVDFLEACKALHIKGLQDESIKTSACGSLLHLMGARDTDEVVQPTKNQEKELLVLHRVKRRRTHEPEVDNVTLQDDEHIDNSQMDSDILKYDDEDSLLSEDPQEKSELKEKSNPASSTTLQYSLSCQGSIMLVLNRYMYRLRHARQNNQKMWRCTDYAKKSCPAFVITKGDTAVERGCAHNHPYHDQQILKRVRNGNMYTAYNAVENIAALNKKLNSKKT